MVGVTVLGNRARSGELGPRTREQGGGAAEGDTPERWVVGTSAVICSTYEKVPAGWSCVVCVIERRRVRVKAAAATAAIISPSNVSRGRRAPTAAAARAVVAGCRRLYHDSVAVVRANHGSRKHHSVRAVNHGGVD